MRIDSSGRLGLGLTPNTSAVATNVSAGLFQTDGNIDIRYAGTNSDQQVLDTLTLLILIRLL